MTWVRQTTTGKGTAKALLILLGELANEEEQILRTQDFLAEILECSKRGLRESLAYLEDHGFIQREKRKGGNYSKSDIITLNIGVFTSTKPVDNGEDDLEGHEAPDATCPEIGDPHAARDAATMRHETPHAMRHETPHIKKINNLNKRVRKDSAADAAPADSTTAPAIFEAGAAETRTAQTLLAEWIDNCNPAPLSKVRGQMAREIKNLLTEGVDYDAVRDGLIQLHQRGQHPATLPSFVHNIQQQPTTAMQPSGRHGGAQGMATGTQRAMQALAAGAQLQAQYDQQNQQNALGGTTSGFTADQPALGASSADRQSQDGRRDDTGMVGNPRPFRFQ